MILFFLETLIDVFTCLFLYLSVKVFQFEEIYQICDLLRSENHFDRPTFAINHEINDFVIFTIVDILPHDCQFCYTFKVSYIWFNIQSKILKFAFYSLYNVLPNLVLDTYDTQVLSLKMYTIWMRVFAAVIIKLFKINTEAVWKYFDTRFLLFRCWLVY